MIKYITLHQRVQDWEHSKICYAVWLDTYGEPVTIDVSTISSFTNYIVSFKNGSILNVAEKHDEILHKIKCEC